ncbi:MAG: Ty1/Copia family ribonuclease HI, partial [Gammaproteobacteria bacterium]
EINQPGLIGQLSKCVGLTDESSVKDTPTIMTILRRDTEGEPREQTWSYRTAIGMLTYLGSTSRPDIKFAVHQCARFSSNPKKSHEIAVKRIVRYLMGTKIQGYILNPTDDRRLDCYVDADFAGMWSPNEAEDPRSVLSRTGYVITYAGCPIRWVSKLQSEIALSMTEAEYIALSQSMRDLIPMKQLLKEVGPLCSLSEMDIVTHSTVFEDNNGALELATAPKMRPRTKHIAIKYHHFREHVKRGTIKIQRVDTKEQLADIFTKPLPRDTFQYLRKKLCGW